MNSLLRNAIQKIEAINHLEKNRGLLILLEKELATIEWSKIYYEFPIIQQTLLKEEKKYLDETRFGEKIHCKWFGWDLFSRVPSAVPILKENTDKICWCGLSTNLCALDVFQSVCIENILDKLDWKALCANPNAVPFIQAYGMDRIHWDTLCANPNAVHLIENTDIENIRWKSLALNPNPSVIALMEAHEDKIYWPYLSQNPDAIYLIERNLDKVHWDFLSKNPAALHLIKRHMDKATTFGLSYNPNPDAAELLKIKLDQKNIKYNNM